MLQDLHVKNFQAHRDLELDLSFPVVTIVGRSDVGKSAILRAIRWLCTNEPAGTEFISHGKQACAVSLVVDGREITRTRGKGENSYFLDGSQYKAFGTGVPEDIAKFLNLAPINFQSQLDPPFWFCFSPGQVSQEINAIISLEKIDSSLANLASELRRSRTNLSLIEERKIKAEQREQELLWVVEADREFRSLGASQASLTDKQTELALLASLLEEGQRVQQRREMLSEAILEAQNFLPLVDKMQEESSKTQDLRNLLEEGESLWQRKNRLEEEIQELQKSLDSLLEGGCPLCGIIPES